MEFNSLLACLENMLGEFAELSRKETAMAADGFRGGVFLCSLFRLRDGRVKLSQVFRRLNLISDAFHSCCCYGERHIMRIQPRRHRRERVPLPALQYHTLITLSNKKFRAPIRERGTHLDHNVSAAPSRGYPDT